MEFQGGAVEPFHEKIVHEKLEARAELDWGGRRQAGADPGQENDEPDMRLYDGHADEGRSSTPPAASLNAAVSAING